MRAQQGFRQWYLYLPQLNQNLIWYILGIYLPFSDPVSHHYDEDLKRKSKFLWLLSDDMVKKTYKLSANTCRESTAILWSVSREFRFAVTVQHMVISIIYQCHRQLWQQPNPAAWDDSCSQHCQGKHTFPSDWEGEGHRPAQPCLNSPPPWTLQHMKLASLGHAEHLVGTAPAYCSGILTCCCCFDILLENTPFSNTGGSTDAGVQAGIQPQ